MSGPFLKIFDKLSGHRAATAIVTCALLILCGISASRMHYDEDISAFVPLDEQTEKYSDVFAGVGGQEQIAVLFRGKEDQFLLGEAMDAFGEAVARRDTGRLARNLQVRIDETAMMDLLQCVRQVYPLLFSDEDYRHAESLLAREDFLPTQMERNKQMLMFPMGSFMAQSLPYDPLNLSAGAIGRLRKLGMDGAYKTIDGHLFKDSTGIVLLESPFGISESRDNERLKQLLDSCMQDVQADYPSLSLSAVGAPLIAVTNATQIKQDSLLAVSLSVVLILSILLYSFRRARDILWIGLSVCAGWLFALGTISLIRDGMSLIVIGIGSVIIGIAVNYPLHFIEHLKHEADMREVLKEMVPPLLVGNITTNSAFLCLVLLDAQAMRDLGLFGSLALAGTILFVLVCLPVLVRPHKNGKARERTIPLGRLTLPQNKRGRRALLWTLAGLTAIFGYFSRDTSFDSDMRHINYMLPQQREDLDFLSSSMQGRDDSTALLYAVAEGKTLDEALRRNEHMTGRITGLDGVRNTVGIAGIMLSDSLRNRRAERWAAFWRDHAHVATSLETAAAAAGFSPEAFSPFEEMMRHDSFLEADSTFRDLFRRFAGHRFIMQDESGYKVVNFVQTDKHQAESVKRQIALLAPQGCFVFSQPDVSNHLAETLSDSFDYLGIVCGLVVFVFLWLSFGSIELSIMAFLPLAVSWTWILGIMQLSGMQFNIVNIILATFIFGQGDDYTIFITEGLMYEYTTGKRRLEQYKNSVGLSAIIMFIGIGTLIFSKHPAMRSLAEVAIIGMATVVFMAYCIPPAIFRWLTEKNGKRREYPVTLSRLASSLFSISFFLFGMFALLIPYTLFIYRPLQRFWNGENSYHRLLQRISHFVIRHVPGVRFQMRNRTGEQFARPAVIVCNHQSHLDLMCLMQLSPKIIVLTNDWVWNNPYYGAVIHTAEFRPVSNGYDRNFPHLQDLVERGYSIVVFPEGTRTPDGEIGRFHKGAFTLAKALDIDILPVCIHGLYDVLPKHDFMLRRGQVTLEIFERLTADAIKDATDRELTNQMHKWYVKEYRKLREELETPAYMAPYTAYKNKYKVSLS